MSSEEDDELAEMRAQLKARTGTESLVSDIAFWLLCPGDVPAFLAASLFLVLLTEASSAYRAHSGSVLPLNSKIWRNLMRLISQILPKPLLSFHRVEFLVQWRQSVCRFGAGHWIPLY
jgi:hypothetical protein